MNFCGAASYRKQVPDFNDMYELYDPCTVMFFFRNKHIMIDLGTGNNNKISWAFNNKQEVRAVLNYDIYDKAVHCNSVLRHRTSALGGRNALQMFRFVLYFFAISSRRSCFVF